VSVATSPRSLTLGLAAATLGLAVAAAWPWLPRAPVALPPPAPASVLAPPRETPPLDGYAPIVERPLFNQTRRPVALSVAAPSFRLDGVTIVGKIRRALIRDLATNRLYHLGEGETVGPWTVWLVEIDRVVLRKDGGELVLSRGR
jgi:hypothetical protein